VSALLPELYLHGLSKGDFELALRGLLGEGATLSPASIERLRGKWQAEYDAWSTRDLSDRELVYVWADGVYVKAGLEREKAALLVVIGAKADGTKEVEDAVLGPQVPRTRCAEADGRRRRRGRLGRSRRSVAGDARATLLEPQARERARCAAQEGAGHGARTAVRDPVCADTSRGREAPRALRQGVPPHAPTRGRDPTTSHGSTGSTCARPTWWKARSRRCGCAPMRRSGSRRPRTRRR
jgi:Transposase, Mutator family